MLNLWEEQGPPVSISVAAYMGLIKSKKSKRRGQPREFDNRNPFDIHRQKPKAPDNDVSAQPVVKAPSRGGDLNELVRQFSGSNGMI